MSTPPSTLPHAFAPTASRRRLASLRRRIFSGVMLMSLLVVGLVDGLHLAQDEAFRQLFSGQRWSQLLLRDLLLALLLGLALSLLLDRLLLRPLRRLAARTGAFDPTMPPAISELPAAEPAGEELQEISQSISRVHQQLWQQLQDEQQRAAGLQAEIEHQQAALRETQLALDQKVRELGSLARVDALTGLANKREFDEGLRREFKRAQRQRGLLALAVLDLDHFKGFNERYGAGEGDVALARFSQLLAERFKRDTDLVARLGGEEFVALLPGVDMSEAQSLLEQLREDLRGLAIPHALGVAAQGGERVLTISVGLAAYSPANPYLSAQALMQAADEALYIAKHAGRDRLSLA